MCKNESEKVISKENTIENNPKTIVSNAIAILGELFNIVLSVQSRFLWLQIIIYIALIIYVLYHFKRFWRAFFIILIAISCGISWLFSEDFVKAHFLFSDAANAVEDGRYEEALKLFESTALSEYPSAILNIGYLYEQGYVQSENGLDLEKALNYYNQVESTDAYRGRLSCYIKMLSEEQGLDETIVQQIYLNINKLIGAQDSATLNYLADCAYGMPYSELSDGEKVSLAAIDLNLLLRWEDSGYYEGYSAPNDTAAVHYEFVKIGFDNDHPYLVYKVYTLTNIDKLSSYQISL